MLAFIHIGIIITEEYIIIIVCVLLNCVDSLYFQSCVSFDTHVYTIPTISIKKHLLFLLIVSTTVASTLWSTVLGVIEELFAQSNSNCSGIVAS